MLLPRTTDSPGVRHSLTTVGMSSGGGDMPIAACQSNGTATCMSTKQDMHMHILIKDGGYFI